MEFGQRLALLVGCSFPVMSSQIQAKAIMQDAIKEFVLGRDVFVGLLVFARPSNTSYCHKEVLMSVSWLHV